MSTAMVIATREIRERSRLLIVAAALAILPFAVALAPGAQGNRGHAIMVVGAAGAFNFAIAIALAMGISTICRDLSEKRLSFYFSKPVSPFSLWFGKSIASLLIALLAAVIIAVPSYLGARDAWRQAWNTGGDRLALAFPILLLLFFFGSHAIATMMRSRSVLVALDFILLVAAVAVMAAILRPVLLAGGMRMTGGIGSAVAGGILIILAIAPVWQLAKGRTDIRRSHLEFSKFFWSAIAVLIVFAGAFVLWLRSVAPADLVDVRDIEMAPAGGHAFVTGIAAHRADFHSTFIVDAKSGAYTRIATPPWSGVRWSRDGRVAAWMQPLGIRTPMCELHIQRVGEKKSVATGIQSRMWGRFILTDDGTRVAVATDGNVAIHDLVNHRVLASAGGFTDFRPELFFLNNDVLRIIDAVDVSRKNVGTLRVSDLDVRTRRMTTYGRRTLTLQTYFLSASDDGMRMFIRTAGEIVDGRTLATIAKIVPTAHWGSTMLSDGAVAIIDNAHGTKLRMFDRDGQPRGEVALPNADNAYVSGETTNGKLIVVSMQEQRHSMIVIDRARLAVERVVPNMKGPMPQWFVDPRAAKYDANTPFLGVDDAGKLKGWSVATGAVATR